MKFFQVFILSLFLCVACETVVYGDSTSPSPNPIAAVAPVASSPLPALPSPTVSVSEASAPPQWAQDLITTAEKLPMVGPFLSKAMLYMGILSTVLTSLIACILGVLSTLMGAMNLAGFANLATAVAKFRDGKVMYWLKFFSLFNAKKPGDPQ